MVLVRVWGVVSTEGEGDGTVVETFVKLQRVRIIRQRPRTVMLSQLCFHIYII